MWTLTTEMETKIIFYELWTLTTIQWKASFYHYDMMWYHIIHFQNSSAESAFQQKESL